jgi:5-methylcytosine-specific restriction endonuclease McrA
MNKNSKEFFDKRNHYRHVYLASQWWKDFRKMILCERGHICQTCGAMRTLQVHHIDYSRLGKEKRTDVVVLCKMCHKRTHTDTQDGKEFAEYVKKKFGPKEKP